MISLPDFKEKQILFVKADWGTPSKLRFFNDNIVFEKEGRVVNRVSIHKTFAVFVAGDLSLTTNFFKQAKEYGVSIFLLKNNFQPYGGLMTEAEGHFVLRMKQYHMSEEIQLDMAKKLIENKIYNQFYVLKEKSSGEERDAITARFEEYKNQIKNCKSHDELRGIEGNASRVYFSKQFSQHDWRRRAPRTKEDELNLFLDIGYTLLFNFIDSLLRLHGFDTYKGFFHRLFFQRRSLACDVMEPLRPLIDKQIVKSLNLKQFNKKDFKIEKGAFMLPFDQYVKYANVFLDCLMDSKEEIFSYVQNFYRFVMDGRKHDFPVYKIDK